MQKIYLAECYKYAQDKKRNVRVLNGTFEDNRDFLTPVTYWTREFYAANKKEAIKKGRALAKYYNHSFKL